MPEFKSIENMEDLLTRMYKERRQILVDLIDKVQPKLDKAPPGKLHGARHRRKWQYYYREPGPEKTGIYIPKSDYRRIHDLGQKEYNTRLVKAASREIMQIDKLYEYFQKADITHPEDIYDKLPLWLQDVADSRWESEEEYVDTWQSQIYTGPKYGKKPDIVTDRGELVRSKSERSIANALYAHHIPYHYEKPLIVEGNPKHEKIFPDFSALNVRKRKEIYWEHFGMADNDGYADGMVEKFTDYYNNGIYPGEQLIVTFETKNVILQEAVINLLIEHYLL